MKGIKSLKLGLVGFAAGAFLLAGGLLMVGQVSAITGSLSVSDATAAPGETATVDVMADVGDPGLGAWTFDITYDPSVISIGSEDDCEPEEGGVCNHAFADDAVRITGASATGIDEPTSLGAITFTCEELGESPLTVTVEVFADATVGDPQDIDETVTDGSVTCEEAAPAEPTATPGAGGAAPTAVPGVPSTGTGSSTGSDNYSWLVAALAGLGVVALAGYSVLRVRTRSW